MYKVISHTADIALELTAESLEALFTDAASGWRDLVLEDAEIRSQETRQISLVSTDPEDLLVQWLSELNFFLTTQFWVFNEVEEIFINKEESDWCLNGRIGGESFDTERHYIYFDIKAVTFHQLNIEHFDGKYQTRVVFDI